MFTTFEQRALLMTSMQYTCIILVIYLQNNNLFSFAFEKFKTSNKQTSRHCNDDNYDNEEDEGNDDGDDDYDNEEYDDDAADLAVVDDGGDDDENKIK